MRLLAILLLALVVSACSSSRDTLPQRGATEQMLISAAVDRAARGLLLEISRERTVYVSDQYLEGYDEKYAVGAIRDSLLKQGLRLVDIRSEANVIVEVRAGALSIDESRRLLGIPSFDLPVPLANQAKTPEIALFKQHELKGVAKIAATAYDRTTGALVGAAGPQYGYSHQTDWTFLLFLSRTTDDLKPERDSWWEW